MNNNEIIPNFDENIPILDSSWIIPNQISWIPLDIQLETIKKFPKSIKVNICGELEAFNGSYLSKKLYEVAGEKFNCIWLNFVNVTIGDYREVLIIPLQRKIIDVNGVLILQNLPEDLYRYFSETLIPINKFEGIAIIENHEQGLIVLQKHVTMIQDNKKNTIKFPLRIICPKCSTTIKFNISVTGKCPKCKTILTVDENGILSMGNIKLKKESHLN